MLATPQPTDIILNKQSINAPILSTQFNKDKQLQKLLLDPKARARLLITHYGKPRLRINIHHYAAPVVQRHA